MCGNSQRHTQFFSKRSFILLQLHCLHKRLCTFLGAHLPQLHLRLPQHCISPQLQSLRVHQGGSPGWSSGTTLDLVVSFYGILLSSCAILGIHFARAVISCDTPFASMLTSFDSFASCAILVIPSTIAITICTIATEVVTIYNNCKSKYIIAKANCYIANCNKQKFSRTICICGSKYSFRSILSCYISLSLFTTESFCSRIYPIKHFQIQMLHKIKAYWRVF